MKNFPNFFKLFLGPKTQQKAKIRIKNPIPFQWTQVHNTALAMPKRLHEKKPVLRIRDILGTDPDPRIRTSD